MTGPIDPKKIARWQEWKEGEDIDPHIAVDAVRALLAERKEREALLSALKAERFDPQRNEVTICGVRYAISMFERLGVAPVGEWVEVVKRDGETVTLRLLHREKAEREDLLALLREVEWVPGSGRDESYLCCPACGGVKEDDGHAPDCRLAAFLRGAT